MPWPLLWAAAVPTCGRCCPPQSPSPLPPGPGPVLPAVVPCPPMRPWPVPAAVALSESGAAGVASAVLGRSCCCRCRCGSGAAGVTARRCRGCGRGRRTCRPGFCRCYHPLIREPPMRPWPVPPPPFAGAGPEPPLTATRAAAGSVAAVAGPGSEPRVLPAAVAGVTGVAVTAAARSRGRCYHPLIPWALVRPCCRRCRSAAVVGAGPEPSVFSRRCRGCEPRRCHRPVRSRPVLPSPLSHGRCRLP